MNCKIIQDLAELYMEQLVSPESVQAVREHLKTCPDCRKYYRSLSREKSCAFSGLLPMPRCGVPSAEKQYTALSRRLRRRHFLEIAGTSAALGAGSVMLVIGIVMTCRLGSIRLSAQK